MYEYRMRYAKKDALRFISHLDLIRAFERAFNRADLPLAYSEGFHPHPRLGLGPALPIGVESVAEYLDLALVRQMNAKDLESSLNEVLPAGLTVLCAVPITRRAKPLTAVINRATYTYNEITGPSGNPEQLARILENVWNSPAIVVVRRTKEGEEKKLDIKPFWHGWKVEKGSEEGLSFAIETEIGSKGTIRPDEIAALLPPEWQVGRIIRTGLWIVNERGRFLPTDLC